MIVAATTMASVFIDEKPPSRIIGLSQAGRLRKGVPIAFDSRVDHDTHAVIPCDAAVIKGAGGGVAIGAMAVGE